MDTELKLLGEMIIEKKNEIAKAVHTNRLAGVHMTEDERRQFEQIEAHILDIRANFITLFGEALVEHLDEQKAQESIYKWGKKQGEFFYNLGVPLDEELRDTSYYRKYFWQAIREEATAQKMSADTVFEVISII